VVSKSNVLIVVQEGDRYWGSNLSVNHIPCGAKGRCFLTGGNMKYFHRLGVVGNNCEAEIVPRESKSFGLSRQLQAP
jgi:hypothetical protein